jgi:hypothetical protein
MTFEELFTVAEIKDVSIMQKNINDDVIATLLQNVKEIEFLPLFKNNFFEEFLQRWSDETQTTTDIQLKHYMLLYITKCIEYRAVTTLSYQIRASGIVSMNAENAVRVSDTERKTLLDQLNSDKEFHKNTMIKFINSYYQGFATTSKAFKNFDIL